MSPEQLKEVCEALNLPCNDVGFYAPKSGWVKYGRSFVPSYLADLLLEEVAKDDDGARMGYFNSLDGIMIFATAETRITAAMRALGHWS